MLTTTFQQTVVIRFICNTILKTHEINICEKHFYCMFSFGHIKESCLCTFNLSWCKFNTTCHKYNVIIWAITKVVHNSLLINLSVTLSVTFLSVIDAIVLCIFNVTNQYRICLILIWNYILLCRTSYKPRNVSEYELAWSFL